MSDIHFHVMHAKSGGAEVNSEGKLNLRAVGGHPSVSIHHPSDEQVAEALAAGAQARYIASDYSADGFFYVLGLTVMGIEVSLFPDTVQVWEVAGADHTDQALTV